jgi:hypothetical protein
VSDDACARYIRFLETLTPETLVTIGAFITDDVVFRDPFNDVTGRAAMQRVLQKMFEDLSQIRFRVTDQASRLPIGFIAWELAAIMAKTRRPLRVCRTCFRRRRAS